MYTITVEVSEAEYARLKALHSEDVQMAHNTVERYLGKLLGLGVGIRGLALALDRGEFLFTESMGGGLSSSPKAPHRGRDRAGWRNGAA